MSEHSRTIVVFDFDHTLIMGDSLWPFLVAARGRLRALFTLAETLVFFGFRYLKNKRDPALSDPRTFIKTHLLKNLLTGLWTGNLTPAVEKLRAWQNWNRPILQILRDHQAQGHHIVIASGGLDLYLPALLEELSYEKLICTQMEVKEGFVSGRMVSGNCVRERKAEMLAAYIAQHGPFEDSWGYGNFPHDVPMLNLLRQRIIV